AYYESSRCLFCYDAPCMNACPTGIDIPLFIRQIHTNDMDGAAKTIYDSNWLGHSCGKVCPTEVLCEGACVYNQQDIKPVEIGRLQSVASGYAIRNNKKLYELPPDNGKKVAIIGAGPAGIAAACELRALGYTVDIFEAKEKPSGLLVHGVAPYKITNEEALDEMAYLQEQMGFKILYESAINSEGDLKGLETNYDAIFLGVGLGDTNLLGLLGSDRAICTGATEFIEELRMKHNHVTTPRNVLVLGGGNTAMDAASESARLGAENVILAYRRGKEDMGAYEFEYELAKSVGVKGLFNVQPVQVVDEGVQFIRTEIVDGKVHYLEGSEFVHPCDRVIFATGQLKHTSFLHRIEGLELEHGKIVVSGWGQTTNPKYFAGGDAVNGGAEVVNGVAEGEIAAHGIHQYIFGA
ncbi:MAG TPA: hypothetical protein ENJ82_06085, partial [Bacteroidetes bacterium]|nr:hypothetical protein [Bacteroidota bacterium]